MDIALIVAKVLGVYLIISGMFLCFKGKMVPYLLRDFFNHPAIVYLTGVILIFISTIFLLTNNVWDGTWKTAVTIFVWMVFGKGLLYIFIPEKLHGMVITKDLGTLRVYGFVNAVVGVLLMSLGN
jgi:hypothetical protein